MDPSSDFQKCIWLNVLRQCIRVNFMEAHWKISKHNANCAHKVVVVDDENALITQLLLVEAYLAMIKVTRNIIVLPCFLFSNRGEMVKI